MITVESVTRADQRRRFHELGRVLFADEPRWAPVLRPYEAWLFDRRHPFRRRAEITRFLARRDGGVVGRLCAHIVDGSTEGWFGAFECTDDAAAVRGMVDAAGEWVAQRGAGTLAGPATFTLADEAGVQVSGFEHGGGTGRPWHPPWYAEHLAAAGLEPLERTFPRWCLPAVAAVGAAGLRQGGQMPPHAGRLGDTRLVLSGDAGAIAAVPDISAGLRETSLRRASRQVESASEAAVVRLEGDPGVLVPALLAAAAAAGYRHVWIPWSPDDREPHTMHQVLGRTL